MKRSALWAACAAILAVAACGQQQSGITGLPPGARTGSAERAHSQPGRAYFTIRIPMKKTKGVRRPAYISFYTKSIAIAVDKGKPTIVNLTFTSPGCTGNETYTQCEISFQVTAGKHVFSLITYDQTNGKGKELSADTDVPFTVVSGSNTPLAVTLGGIARSMTIVTSGAPETVGSGSVFTMYASVSAFYFVPVDADGAYILSNGAPTTTLTTTHGNPHVTIARSSISPNIYSVTSTYLPTNPLTPIQVAVKVVSTPIPTAGGSTVRASASISIYQPWLYVTNQYSSTVSVTDQYGTVKTLPPSPAPFSHVPDPSGIAYDTNNTWPYIPSIDDNLVCVYNVLGGLVSVGNWPQLDGPTDIAYVPATGGNYLYLANSGVRYVARKHAQHRANRLQPRLPRQDGYNGSVTAYDEEGNQQSLSGGFLEVNSPRGIAYDPHNGMLYVTDDGLGTVLEYDTQGNLIANFSSTLPYTTYGGIAFDPETTYLYAVDQSSGTVDVFDENGVVQELTPTAFSGLSEPNGIAYDPYNGAIYVTDDASNTVYAFSETGSSLFNFSSSGSGPWGIAAVP